MLPSPGHPTTGTLDLATVGPARSPGIDTRARIDHMRAQYPAPNGFVGLVPLHIGYAFEVDGDDDVVGVVVDTTLGGFVLWLAADNAVQLAGQLVMIVENRDRLRDAYARRAQTGAVAESHS